MEIKHTEAQMAVIQNRGGGLLVSAAAGSGKTSVLVDRLLDRILKEQRRIDEFLIITFTKAAAQELRSRIGRALSQKLREDPGNRHLQRQSMLLYKTQISTIHSLCTVMLREWGHAIDLPLDFSLCEEEDARLLMQQALLDELEQQYENIDSNDEFAKLLDILSAGRDDSRLMDIVLDVFRSMQSHPNPTEWMKEQKTQLALEGIQDAGETIWGQLLLGDTKRRVSFCIEELSRAIDLCEEEESLNPYLDSLMETREDLEGLYAATEIGWDTTAASSVSFPRLKPIRNCPNPRLQDQVKLIRSHCKDTVEGIEDRFACSSKELLEDMRLLHPAMMGLFDLVEAFSKRYSRAKQRKGLLDFSDLEHKAVALLIGEDGDPTEIARQIGSRYAEIMVDEYQDTNQVQNTIFMALSDEGRNLFFVGDVKQSIYRFRLADPTIFLDKYRRFLPYEKALGGQARKILLSQNFRSRPEVLDAVNDLFRQIMSEELGEMNYTHEEALYPGGAFHPGEGFETELHVLHFEELAEGEKEQSGKQPGNHELEARFVANEIARLLTQPFLVSDGDGGLRPVTPEDIAILLRSPGTVRHHYRKALRELEIPWAEDGEDEFFHTTEISVLLSFLKIIDNPRQDVPLLSVLHSPLYGFDGEQLAQIRQAGESDCFSALKAAGEAGMEACRVFLQDLEQLRFDAAQLPSHELIWKLYEKTNALEIFGQMPGGTQREENLLAFYELACRYENSGHRGLFGFLFHVTKVQESGASILKGGAGEQSGVKIVSIHRSKGLEYPVVFLTGLGRRFNYSDMQKPVLFHTKLGLGPRGVDAQRMVEFQTLPRQAVALQLKREMLAEEMRLLYVAMTRAKDKLIMTHALSFGEGDLRKLAPYCAYPVDPNVLANCSCVGQWVLLAAMARPEGEVLRKVGDGESNASPDLFGLPWRIQYHRGIPAVGKGITERTQETSSEAKEGYSPEKLWELLRWRYPYEALASIPAKLTATQLTKARGEVELPATKAGSPAYGTNTAFRRPSFATTVLGLTPAQRGTALHTVLQCIRLEQTDTLQAVQEEIQRLVAGAYLTAQEGEVVSPESIYRFFQTALGQQMRRTETLYREFPFSILLPANFYYDLAPQEEQLLFQGVIDCWFETDEGITLLDFKTNRIGQRDVEAAAEQYRQQLEAYAYALEQMTGKQVSLKILWFLTPNCGVKLEKDGTIKKL